ncbi:MAG: DUF1905 domain-containing protein [Bacteroidota bacterium]
MSTLEFRQPIRKLEKRKGGYYYFEIDANVVNTFSKKRSTRLVCTLENSISYSCGLNHLGNGNFFIIVATKYIQGLKKDLGQEMSFKIEEDPNPLGVEIPEVLEVLLSQDERANSIFQELSDGKKRSLIYAIRPIKDIDKQVKTIIDFLGKEREKMR